MPNAHTLAGEEAPIVARALDVPSVLSTLPGSVTVCQPRPSQCSTTGWKLACPCIRADPIAQASFVASAAMSLSWIVWFFAWTLAATRQSAAPAARAVPARPATPAVPAVPAAPAAPAAPASQVALAAVAVTRGTSRAAPATRAYR